MYMYVVFIPKIFFLKREKKKKKLHDLSVPLMTIPRLSIICKSPPATSMIMKTIVLIKPLEEISCYQRNTIVPNILPVGQIWPKENTKSAFRPWTWVK
jgi:hypothetical protein